ncbi:MAG: YihA family ribosome biogenesis GTP-binding protein [Acidobacteria bacterium]|nr:MAG: YihA family ribosome biogenesis GTP-binding protein [Acidobacteriota bacterium]
MRIHTAEYIISAAKPAQFIQDNLPHFVFAGRSNVGKSSIINRILNRKSLARTSSSPGKTRCINYFLINKKLYFVDLPGYGYAKVSKKERQSWEKLIENYLTNTRQIAMIYSLVDSRHDPSPMDVQLKDWLKYFNLPFTVLLTKADKLSRSKAHQQLVNHSRLLELPKSDIILTSAESGQGIKAIWKSISAHSNPID